MQLVIGAGPAGLSAALEIQRLGGQALVLEQDPQRVGGLSQTAEYRGYRFDIGGHRFFSKNQEVENLWTDLLGDELLQVARSSRIYYGGKYYAYPLRPWNALVNLGLWEACRCLASYGRARFRPRRPVRSFEDWVINQFGERLFSIFFKTYTEKVWGQPCHEISSDWAAQRIKGLSLWTAVLAALGLSGGSQIKTLIDTFRYPRLGPGQMWEAAARRVRESGGQVLLNYPVTRLLRDHRGITAVEAGGREFLCESVISSMPLRQLVERLDPAVPPEVLQAARCLRYRDFITVVLIVQDRDLFRDNWIYIHDPGVKVGRIQNYKNWSPAMAPQEGTTALGMEYFCFQGDGLWSSPDEQLLELARRELAQLGISRAEDYLDGTVVRMPKAYPVYDHDYLANIQRIRDYLQDQVPNLQVAGRNGMHRYNNQDHAMMTGIFAARNCLDQGQYDLWKVNEDAEYLEEVSPQDRMGRLQPGTLPLTSELPV